MYYRNDSSDDNVKSNVGAQYTEDPTYDEQEAVCPFCYEEEYSSPQNDPMSRRRRRPMMHHNYGMMPMPYMPYMIHYHIHHHYHHR